MTKVEFEEVPYLSVSIGSNIPRRPKMIEIIMKAGLAKTEKGSGYFLAGIIVASFAFSIFILVYFVLGVTPTYIWSSLSGKTEKTDVVPSQMQSYLDRQKKTNIPSTQ